MSNDAMGVENGYLVLETWLINKENGALIRNVTYDKKKQKTKIIWDRKTRDNHRASTKELMCVCVHNGIFGTCLASQFQNKFTDNK